MERLGHYQSGWSGRDRVRIAGALLLAAFAASLGWFGLVTRYGSNQLASPLGTSDWIQIGAPFVLALLMLAAAWLVRGVVLARLQVAVLLSLVVHVLLLLMLQMLRLPTGLVYAPEPAELEGALELLTVPDYGGMEAPEVSPEAWQTDVAVSTPERQLDEQSRQSTEPDRPRERAMQETMPENRVDPAELGQVHNEQMPNPMPETPQERLARQSIQQPTVADSPAEAPDVSTARVAEMTPRDVAADLKKQAVDPAAPNQAAKRDQLPDMNREMAADRDAARAEIHPTMADRASLSAPRRTQSPSAAESPIESSEVGTARRADQFAPSESPSGIERRSAELSVAGAPAARSARLGQVRSWSAKVAAARSDQSPQVSGGSSSPQMARSRAGSSMQSAEDQIDAPQVSGGSAAARGARLEPGGTGVSRSAASGLSGSRGPASPLASLSAPGTRGAGSAAEIGRVPTRESIGAPSGSGGSGAGSGTSLARGNVGGTVTGAIGAAESVQVSEAPSGGRGAGIGKAPGQSTIERSSPGTVAARGEAGSGVGSGPGLAPSRRPEVAAGNPNGRGADAAARLSSDSAGGGRATAGFAGRATPSSGTPRAVSGGIEGEATALTPGPQPGAGLTSGPQPGGSPGGSPGIESSTRIGGSETGPRTSLSRRAAGLPGGMGSGSAPSPSGAMASVARPSIGAPARRAQADSPELHPLVSQIARQVPGGGLGKSTLAETSPAFSLRTGEMRKEAARTLGGTPETERAVEMGIAWLAQHQAPDGSWGIHDFIKQCKGHQCDGTGSFESPTAATGLALLAFLGAGYTHQSGQYQDHVARGIKWLVARQKSDGDLFASEVQFVQYYSHGIAAIALCEAYGMTKDPELREPTQMALQFILDSQHPQLGGWRYVSRRESDTSVSGWQLMALKSGEMAGFQVPATAYEQVTRWLDSVERGPGGGLYAYHPTRPESLAMTAEGLLMRQYLGFTRNNPRLRAGAGHLDRHLPDLSERDAYYWYYATQMMYHMQGSHWERWNGRLRDMLTGMQSKDGGTYGSWSPSEPTPDRWGAAGGRLYITCMHLLVLEVYYRHLPLYQQLEH